MAANGYGIILTTWTADFPTPGSFLAPLVDGRTIRSAGNTNYARLNDPEINALVDSARATGEDAAWREVAVRSARPACTCRSRRPVCSWSAGSACATAW